VVHSVKSDEAQFDEKRAGSGSFSRADYARSRHERVFAGVAGGLARESDPTLLRLCFVVLIPFFGLGVIAYGLAWLVLPVDDEMRVPLPRPSSGYLFGIGLLSVGALLSVRLFFDGVLGQAALPTLVIVAGVLFVWGANGVVEPTSPINLDLKVPTAATSAGLLLVVVGVLGVLQLSGVVALDTGSLAALLLVGIGVATIVGAFGRPWPGLVVTGSLLAFALGFVTLVNTPIGDGIGDRTLTPVASSELSESQQLTMGSLVLDLTDLASEADSEPVLVSSSVMVGDLTVILPEDAVVTGDMRVGTGRLLLFGETQQGLIIEETLIEETSSEETSSDESTTFVLDLRVGLGSIVINRETSNGS
jgi:phage shock protein PspC (stress-responsive transcriptional regulator)